MNSGYDSDFHNDHLRGLLDQRAARAGLHGRFPSLSEFSDSPSIYSHAQFSPRPMDRGQGDATPNAFHHTVYHYAEPRTPMSDRQRLDIPEASSLDLDDDPRASGSFTTHHEDEEDDSATEEASGDTEAHTLGAYGPKMTVHSRAPWETGEDDSYEAEDQTASKRGGFTFAKKDNNKRLWGKDTRGAGTVYPRPSLDSLRSRGKQSFETASTSSQVSAGGALLALAQASMSSTSLGLSPSPQGGLREKLSLPRFRSRTPTGNRLEPVDSRQPRYRAASPACSEYSRTDSRPSSSNPPSPRTPSHQPEYHPYANPHLVRNYTRNASPPRLEESHTLSTPSPQSPVVGRSESFSTVTESTTATTMSTLMQSQSDATIMTPGTSVSSLAPAEESKHQSRMATLSSDAPTDDRSSGEAGAQDVFIFERNTAFPSPVALTPGWAGPSSPFGNPIKLISLEEAQAQVRERSRSATATAVPNSPAPTVNSRFPEQGFAQSALNWSRLRSASGSSGKASRGFTSASTADLQSPPPLPSEGSTTNNVRQVGRKKSAILRLFNSKEKVPPSPPPMPSISANVIAPPTPLVSPRDRSRKQSAHRVPVPSITPSILADSETGSSDSPSEEATKFPSSDVAPASAPPRERQLSSRRNAPGLSIVTSNNPLPVPLKSPIGSDMLRDPFAAKGEGFIKAATPSPRDETKVEFAALSLRPVSTNFSADFTGRIGTPGRPSLDVDMGTPTTGASAISPRSPPLLYKLDERRNDGHASFGIDPDHDDQSAIIRALQEQIVTSKKAWQQQLWELEGQVRDLKAEVEELRVNENGGEYCSACGRGSRGCSPHELPAEGAKKAGTKSGGVVNRPRARTGTGTRFASAT